MSGHFPLFALAFLLSQNNPISSSLPPSLLLPFLLPSPSLFFLSLLFPFLSHKVAKIKAERGSRVGRYIIASTAAKFNDPANIFGMPRYNIIRRIMSSCGIILFYSIWFDIMWCSMMPYDGSIRWDTVRCSVVTAVCLDMNPCNPGHLHIYSHTTHTEPSYICVHPRKYLCARR